MEELYISNKIVEFIIANLDDDVPSAQDLANPLVIQGYQEHLGYDGDVDLVTFFVTKIIEN